MTAFSCPRHASNPVQLLDPINKELICIKCISLPKYAPHAKHLIGVSEKDLMNLSSSLFDIFEKDAARTLEILGKAKKKELYDSALFISVVQRVCTHLPAKELEEVSTGTQELV